ncbi:glutamine synthetase-like [Pomacea canaliculata]|uniref:glutamine synthetase-like n=1 Tax=Pomacea canaliculata TaxID=400727 RepID=UPI000D7315C2|nr:glutamine synthetase-like [Pomacea canaliculata]
MSLISTTYPLGSNKQLLQHYLTLPQEGPTEPERKSGYPVQLEYIWIDSTGQTLRSKCRTEYKVPAGPGECLTWNYDGSSTGQADPKSSDTFIKPVAIYPDPFRRGPNKLVLCEVLDCENRKPVESNRRASCKRVMDDPRVKVQEPWFGIEQEYTLLDMEKYPLGWPRNGYPAPQGPYYCGIGPTLIHGRDVAEAHYRACMYCGIKISGINAEVMPSQWEFQVGPCESIEMGDQLWVARYLLHRIAEDFGCSVTLDPKPMYGNWNGAGAHCNFSTKTMRELKGLIDIHEAIEKLKLRIPEHIRVYDAHEGEDNKKRLTGMNETCKIDEFRWGVADRTASVRIPRQVNLDGCGYLEERRPAANADPYAVTEMMVRTIILDEGLENIENTDDSISLYSN